MKRDFDIKKRLSPENIVYTVLWAVVFILPVCEQLLQMIGNSSSSIDQTKIFGFWLCCLPVALLFILHNCRLLPKLLLQQKTTVYLLTTLSFAALTLFVSDKINFELNHRETRPTFHRFEAPRFDKPFDLPSHKKPNTLAEPPFDNDPPHLPPLRPDFGWKRMLPMIPIILLITLCILGNIAIKLFFRSLDDKVRLKELEYHNLQSELQYLKHQINPHFFMNTLNNIHALVDIDAETAKETIIELSKLMRYVLYETDKKLISIEKEVSFLKSYTELMMKRYPKERVDVDFSISGETNNVLVPPLLFISFVENAFKHGISYRSHATISVSIESTPESLTFNCVNPITQQTSDKHHGIGLSNIQKRLHLLYNDNYKLVIDNNGDTYNVKLTLPIQTNEHDTEHSN